MIWSVRFLWMPRTVEMSHPTRCVTHITLISRVATGNEQLKEAITLPSFLQLSILVITIVFVLVFVLLFLFFNVKKVEFAHICSILRPTQSSYQRTWIVRGSWNRYSCMPKVTIVYQ